MVSNRNAIDRMRQIVQRHAHEPLCETAIPGLSLSLLPRRSSGAATVHTPVTCLILQGAKRVTIGNAVLQYDSASYFVASLDVPAAGEIIAASPDCPYIAVGLQLDRTALADLIARLPTGTINIAASSMPSRSFGTSDVTPDLLDAWAAFLTLLDRPEDIATLAPLREREILYRLLRGPLGGQLCQMAQDDNRLARIRRAVAWMRDHYGETLRTSMLAQIAGMSVASFHRHFRTATTMTPLQYQKSLRLQAARRLLTSGLEASSAAYAVGYESPSQFSREYSRCFGHSPSRDADMLRGQRMAV